jgi:hypothetical protein
MLITPANLLLIGYEQSTENHNQYVRGDEMWDFNPSFVDFLNRAANSDHTPEEAKASSQTYNSFKERTEKEIKERLGI